MQCSAGKLAARGYLAVTLLWGLVSSACSSSTDIRVGAQSTALSAAGGGRLRDQIQVVRWSGSLGPEDAPSGSEPGICATSRCESFALRVELPPHIFDRSRDGGVEVSLRWFDEFDALNLYVYHDGDLVASGEGIISTAHSLFLPAAENGEYQVLVAYDAVNSMNDVVGYEALAEVEFLPRKRPVRQLLPDLVYRPQRNVTFDLDLAFFEPAPPPGSSCYTSETDEDGAQNCLRFDQVMTNVGRGDLETRLFVPKDPNDPNHHSYQRIYYSDSRDHYEDVLSSDWIFHPIHDHYHVQDFAQTNLWEIDAQGQRAGSEPLRVGHKISFCIADIELDEWGTKGNGPRQHNAPDCLSVAYSDDTFNYYLQGLTRGWTDIYEYYLPGQYVEVSGVPDGNYILETVMDPDNHLIESDDANNCGSLIVEISGVGTNQAHVEIVGPGPACPSDAPCDGDDHVYADHESG